MKKMLTILFILFILVFVCFCLTAYAARSRFYEIEIAPGEYAVMKFFPIKRRKDEVMIRFKDQFINLPVFDRTNYLPESIMYYNDKIYAIWLDRSSISDMHFDFYEQAGGEMREIPASEYPKSIAINNVWFPATGDKKHDEYYEKEWMIPTRELDVNNKKFRGTTTAHLWYQLGTGAKPGDIPSWIDSEFLKTYMEKYDPVRLRHERMRLVPGKDSDFPKDRRRDKIRISETAESLRQTVRYFLGIMTYIYKNRRSVFPYIRRNMEAALMVRKMVRGIRSSRNISTEVSPELGKKGVIFRDVMFLSSLLGELIDANDLEAGIKSSAPLTAWFRIEAYDSENRLVGTFTSDSCSEIRDFLLPVRFVPDSDFDQRRIKKMILTVRSEK